MPCISGKPEIPTGISQFNLFHHSNTKKSEISCVLKIFDFHENGGISLFKNQSTFFLPMAITDKLSLTEKHTVPAGCPVDFISFKDKNIYELLDQLKKINVDIKIKDSEQNIKYLIKGEYKESTIPLNMLVNGQSVEGYILRTDGLEIKIEDYRDYSPHAPKGVMGGSVTKKGGIVCDIICDGYNNKKGLEIIDNVREVIREFYEPLSEIDKQIKEMAKSRT